MRQWLAETLESCGQANPAALTYLRPHVFSAVQHELESTLACPPVYRCGKSGGWGKRDLPPCRVPLCFLSYGGASHQMEQTRNGLASLFAV